MGSQQSTIHRIFVKNCAFEATEDDLRNLFEENGFMVQHVHMPTSAKTGNAKGFAFVDLDDPQQLQDAIDSLNGSDLLGRALTIESTRSKQKNARYDSGAAAAQATSTKRKARVEDPARG